MTIGQKRYRVKYDYHTHTTYSHGKGSIEDNVREAVERGLSGIAIADHGPGHLFYGIDKKKLPEMRATVEALRRKYAGMEIFLSVEANLIHTGKGLDIKKEEYGNYDFLLAGYHYGVRNGYCLRNALCGKGLFSEKQLRRRNTDMAVRAIYENPIKVLTHPGEKGPFDLLEIAKACADRGTLMEINAHHTHLTAKEICAVAEKGVLFIVDSDAHRPERVGDCEAGIRRALEAGLDMGRIVNIEEAD